jgi:hypothetical protein
MKSSKENLTKEERRRLKAERRLEKVGLPTPLVENLSIPIQHINSGVTVLCVKFGNKYGDNYVERLRNMVARHMTVPYEFVCLTDSQHQIPGVRMVVQPNANYQRGWWHKVHMFDPSLPLGNRILYFDLDVIIHANINKLVTTFANDFLGILDFNRKFHPHWNNLNSSVMAWNHGTQKHIWERFQSNPRDAMKLHGDQDWIWKHSKDRIKWWPREWIQSYKWEIRSRSDLILMSGKRRFKSELHTPTIHSECCVAVFHGDPKPEDVKDKFVVDNWQ